MPMYVIRLTSASSIGSTCNPVTLPGACTPADYRVLYANWAGNLTVVMADGTSGTLTATAGQEFVGLFTHVKSTGLTASNIIAWY